jgi:RHS repeat-associated protein
MIKGTARLLILLCCVLSAAEESRAVSSHGLDAPFTAFAAFPAAMPEFKNEKQLATWRAEQASKADTRTAEETHAFYTGKPYVGSSGGYAFQYRSYNPELARWTSEDPSGFPDGANGYISVNNQVTNEFDPNGLWHVKMTSYGNAPGNTSKFIWHNYVGGLTADGSLTSDTAPNTLASNIGVIGMSTADYTGKTPFTIGQSYSITVDDAGNLHIESHGDDQTTAGGLGIAVVGTDKGDGTQRLTLNYKIAAAEGTTGLTSVGATVLGTGATFGWTYSTSSLSGTLSITFVAVNE